MKQNMSQIFKESLHFYDFPNHFVGLALKGLTKLGPKCFQHFTIFAEVPLRCLAGPEICL